MTLVRTDSFDVDSSYVPPSGQEVYDTVTGESYRGNGYDPVSALTPIAAGGGAEVPTEVIVYVPFYFDMTQNAHGSTFSLMNMVQMTDAALIAVSLQVDLPEGWTTIDVEMLAAMNAVAGNVFLYLTVNAFDTTVDPFDMDQVLLDDNVIVASPETVLETRWYPLKSNLLVVDALDQVDKLQFYITRDGGHGSDTYADNLFFHALRITESA